MVKRSVKRNLINQLKKEFTNLSDEEWQQLIPPKQDLTTSKISGFLFFFVLFCFVLFWFGLVSSKNKNFLKIIFQIRKYSLLIFLILLYSSFLSFSNQIFSQNKKKKQKNKKTKKKQKKKTKKKKTKKKNKKKNKTKTKTKTKKKKKEHTQSSTQ